MLYRNPMQCPSNLANRLLVLRTAIGDFHFQRAQTEAVTFLGNQESSRSLYAIPGLDYVAHDDIMPYTSVERVPLQHELFDKFLVHNPDKGNVST